MVFSLDSGSGELAFGEHTSTEGDWPMDFEIEHSRKFVVAANQESGNAVLYSRDEFSGRLTLITSDITVPYGVCVKFLNY